MHNLVEAHDENRNHIGRYFGLEDEARDAPFEVPRLVLWVLMHPPFGEDVHPYAGVEEGYRGGDGGLEETAVGGVFVKAVGGEDVA